MQTVDGNIVFYQITVHCLRKLLGVLNACSAMYWRLSFNVDDVTLASVHALDHVIKFAFSIG